METNKELNPLTYLVLISLDETKSNASGYKDASGTCKKLTKKQIRAGYKSDCDTSVNTLNTAADNTPQGQDLQKAYEDVKKKGWVGTAADYAKEYAKTPQGREMLNWVGSLLAPMLGNQQLPEMSNAGLNASKQYRDNGLSPTTWILIALGGVAVLAGVGIAIYKYTK